MNDQYLRYQRSLHAKRLEPEIRDGDPWHGDVLQRKALAKKLISYIDHQTRPLVISIDGDWGSGKTFFLERLKVDLQNNRFKAIYFNAWADDFYSDPLVALLGQIIKCFEYEENEAISELIENTEKVLQSVMSDVIKKATGVDVKKAIDQAETHKDEILSQYVEHSKNKDFLKESLKKLAWEYRKQHAQYGQPLVLMIDELDRCRPTFAVELLERVKHIFDIENIVFILGITKSQLEKSINSIYGNINPEVYLRKFFDRDFVFPQANLEHFFNHQINRYGLEDIFNRLSSLSRNEELRKDFRDVNQGFPRLFAQFDISLRDLDDIMKSLIFIAKTCPEGGSFFPLLTMPLLLIRLLDRKLYDDFMDGTVPPIKVFDFFMEGVEKMPRAEEEESFFSRIFLRMEAHFYLLHSRKKVDKIVELLHQIRGGSNVSADFLSKKIQNRKGADDDAYAVLKVMDGLTQIDQQPPTLQYINKLLDLN